MPDKLATITDCLLLKGQFVPANEDDGSKEWNVCSAAYDHGVAHLLEEHDWKFSTAIEVLTRSGDSDDPDYDDAYSRPNGCLHIIWVRFASGEGDEYVPADYKIVGNQILLDDGDGIVKAKFVVEPDATEFPAMFNSALRELVYAGIESGLKHDAKQAAGHQAAADVFLQRARTRTDQQEPKRALFRTRHRSARLARRG